GDGTAPGGADGSGKPAGSGLITGGGEGCMGVRRAMPGLDAGRAPGPGGRGAAAGMDPACGLGTPAAPPRITGGGAGAMGVGLRIGAALAARAAGATGVGADPGAVAGSTMASKAAETSERVSGIGLGMPSLSL